VQARSQYVDVDAQVIPDGTLTYSVAGWFRLAGGSGRRFLWETAPSHWAISAEISATGQLQVFVRQSILNSLSLNTGFTPASGQWNHLAVAFDAIAGEVRIWINGQRTSGTLAVPAGSGTAPTTGFHIGSYRAGDGRFFDGELDEVGVWSRLLTSGEVELLASGRPILPSTTLPPITISGVPPAGFSGTSLTDITHDPANKTITARVPDGASEAYLTITPSQAIKSVELTIGRLVIRYH